MLAGIWNCGTAVNILYQVLLKSTAEFLRIYAHNLHRADLYKSMGEIVFLMTVMLTLIQPASKWMHWVTL